MQLRSALILALVAVLLAPVASADREVTEATALEREVTLDADTAFAAMAVSARTGEPVGFADLASGTVARTHALDVAEVRVGLDIADLNTENVFSALALGLVDTTPDTELEALASAARLEQASREAVVTERDVRVEPRQALFAIALATATGGDLRLSDVTDVEESVVDAASANQTVRVGEGNALLALALGHGAHNDRGAATPDVGAGSGGGAAGAEAGKATGAADA